MRTSHPTRRPRRSSLGMETLERREPLAADFIGVVDLTAQDPVKAEPPAGVNRPMGCLAVDTSSMVASHQITTGGSTHRAGPVHGGLNPTGTQSVDQVFSQMGVQRTPYLPLLTAW